MQKVNKLTFALLLSGMLVGCTNINDSMRATAENYQQYQTITQKYQIDQEWWKQYQDPQLNKLIELALENNLDLAKSAIAVNIAMYRANLIGADLLPVFSGGTSSSASKNIKRGGNSTISHQANLNLSYTLDLWQRLADSADAATWEKEATVEDLAAARLAIINGVVNSYYSLAYLKQAIKATEDSIKYYNQINQLIQNKLRYGTADQVSVAQTKQAVLSAENNLISLQTQQKTTQQVLRDLLNLKPEQTLDIKYPDILTVKNVGVNLDVPVSVIANRPDVKAAEYRLQSAFKNAEATQKSWFPSISLGSSLRLQGEQISTVSDLQLASGVISINLPFLAWQQVQANVNISEANYEIARLNFEQKITTALNEIDTLYYGYQQANATYKNVQDKYRYDKEINRFYKNRYNAGVTELKDWLSAANTEKLSQLNLLNAKYNIIKNETAVYQAMAGYYSNAEKSK